MEEKNLLEMIHSPEDLHALDKEQLHQLCREIREQIVQTVSVNGGHLGPNLGTVELTVALHRVFHAPEDKILWDVGHQAYTHKLLTGRNREFHTLRRYGGISGFPHPAESEYDPFISGHAGTAVSAALGYAASNERQGKSGHVAAVVGDGSLICGLTMEALNNVRSTCKNLIIIINDNRMSISKSVGAIPNYLNRIITGKSYNHFKAFSKMVVGRMPGGEEIIGNIQKIEGAAKSLFVPGIFFEEMGLRYIGPVDGHQLPELIQTLERVKEFNRPVIVHVITKKGAGCQYALEAPERFHGVSGFDPGTGALPKQNNPVHFSSEFGKVLCELSELHPEIAGITAAMRSGTGMKEFSEKYPERFHDVGIAEGHALTFAAGLAANGIRPVVSLYATFLQRALDSLYHDICLQNLPVLLCVDRSGAVEDGPTHHGLYDESFALSMPNLQVLVPKNEQELRAMMFYAYESASPVMIRYPRGSSGLGNLPVSEMSKGKSEVIREGNDLVIWAVGREVGTALQAADLLEKEHGISCRIVNPRFLKPLDSARLLCDAAELPLVTLEDTVSGTGLDMLSDRLLINETHHRILHFAWQEDTVIPHGDVSHLRNQFGLDAVRIAERIWNEIFMKNEIQGKQA